MKQSHLYIKLRVAFQFHLQSGLVNLRYSQTLIRQLQVGKHTAAPGTSLSLHPGCWKIILYQWQPRLCPIYFTLLLLLLKRKLSKLKACILKGLSPLTANCQFWKALDLFQYNLTHTCQEFELCIAQCRICDWLVLSSDYSLMALSENIFHVSSLLLSRHLCPLLPAGLGYLHISHTGTEMHQCLSCLLVLHN